MKKWIISLMMILLFSSPFIESFADENKETINQEDSIKVFLDEEQVSFGDVAPMIVNDRTIVPFRIIFEKFGLNVGWNQENKVVTGIKDNLNIALQIDNEIAMINEIQKKLDVPPQIINNRTMVPLRFVAESMGAQVKWDGETRTIYITSPSKDILVGITQRQFIEKIVEIMGWEIDKNLFIEKESNEKVVQEINDNNNENFVEAAKQHGLILNTENLDKYITKQDVELMFIRSIGFDLYKDRLNSINDIDIKKLNIEKPVDALIANMYEKVNKPITELNGIYAIKSSPQIELIKEFDSISFGWSKLKHDGENVKLVMDGEGFYLPESFDEPFNKAKNNEILANLMVYGSEFEKDENGVGIISKIIFNDEVREEVIDSIVQKVKYIKKGREKFRFDGVVIDFEDLKDERLKEGYNEFLKDLKSKLKNYDKKLYVMVQPHKYYKGYDYKTIGEIADKVIIMAHDYYQKKEEDLNVFNLVEEFENIETPLAPIENKYNKDFDIYNTLKYITDEKTGIQDKDKILLQISIHGVQWIKGINNEGEEDVWMTTPSIDLIKLRIQKQLEKNELEIEYNKEVESPCLKYFNEELQTENIIWYEDGRSIKTKINLAKLFDIKAISIWRLGNIPNYNEEYEKNIYLDIWNTIKEEYKGN